MVLDRTRLAYLVQAVSGEIELTIVRNGAVVTVRCPRVADGRLGVTWAKEDIGLDWSDVRETP